MPLPLPSMLGAIAIPAQNFAVSIIDTEANIFARTGDDVGTIAFGTDTEKLYVLGNDGWSEWLSGGFVISIIDTSSNILARTGDDLGTIAFGTDTQKLYVASDDGWSEWGFSNAHSINLDGSNDRAKTSIVSSSGEAGAISISGEFTISCWFKSTSGAGWDLIGSGMGGSAWYFGLVKSGSTAYYKQAGGVGTLQSSSLITYDEWHHLLIARDSSFDIKVYLDGNEAAIASGSSGSSMNLDYIGVYYNGTYDGFEGLVDEFAVWGSDQTSNLSAIYNSGTPANLGPLSPLHWWRMEEGTGATVEDNGVAANNPLSLDNGTSYSADTP